MGSAVGCARADLYRVYFILLSSFKSPLPPVYGAVYVRLRVCVCVWCACVCAGVCMVREHTHGDHQHRDRRCGLSMMAPSCL